LNTDFWWGWRGPQNWRWGELTAEQKLEWDNSGRSFVVLAGIEWKILIEAFHKAKGAIKPENLLEIRYEDLCADCNRVIKNVLDFCELDQTRFYPKYSDKFVFRNQNYKWQKSLSSEQKKVLGELLQEYLCNYGYT
jgi:hypothetical protein